MYVRPYLLALLLIFSFSKASAQETKQQRMAALLSKEAASGQFSGSVLIAKGNEILFQDAYGFADKSTNTLNKTSTQFSLASLGKLFTMVAIMKLVDEGKLSLDDKLTNFVTGFADERAKEITIQHLLSHRAGWQHYWNHPDYLQNRHKVDSIADYTRFIKNMPLDFKPGTRNQYSNIGFVLLGAVIEKVTGDNYYNHIHQTIFKPLGMFGADYAPYLSLGPNYARHGADGTNTSLLEMTAARGTADGGGYATTADLSALGQTLFRGTLLSENSKALVVSGFRSNELQADWRTRFAGGFPGVSTILGYLSKEDLTIIILSNGLNNPALDLMNKLASIMEN